MLRQQPANSPSSFFATHIKAAQATLTCGSTIDAPYGQEVIAGKNAKERLAFFRKCIRSGQPFFFRSPDKTEALLLALGEKFLNGRRWPLTDLDDRNHGFL
jgi:hypothetical protein